MSKKKPQNDLQENGEQEERPKRTMLYFTQENLIIPYWGMTTIEKSEQFDDNTMKWQHTIVLNKNFPTESTANPIGERTLRYNTVEQRDKAFDGIIQTLIDLDYQFVTF